MTPPYGPRLSRRATLQWLAATSAASAIPYWSHAASGATPLAPGAQGYGTDPNLHQPVVPWPRTMTSHQLQLTAVLADLILPAAANAPAASAVGVPDFIDEWVSAPYPVQLEDRKTLFDGLVWVDTVGSQDAIVQDALASQSNFFRRFRYLVVAAYYTTPEGFQDIGYTGNVPLASYPPITDEERRVLQRELEKLGLSYA